MLLSLSVISVMITLYYTSVVSSHERSQQQNDPHCFQSLCLDEVLEAQWGGGRCHGMFLISLVDCIEVARINFILVLKLKHCSSSSTCSS